ncbi:DUF1800 domain-containing protein [Aeromicrobium endophyticum]|uniref:DUF1800 domain-containing protein n=1 Tax=Aeromicrobium endophyticum TaxID=2292704 RepID=A0A371PD84_9ACTN|nr:DUF1800 domain-containing protein [Aeromicrobium endophyticum]REK73468.1 DUF1800 domain-containing protein [Aeromicrobium endophyticum]
MGTTRRSAAVTPATLSARQQLVANRFSFGVDEDVVADMRSVGGWQQWFERQLAPSRLVDTAGARVSSWFPMLADDPAAAWGRVKREEKSAWDFGYDFSSYTLARKLVARRQVQEVMADFWSNLLYIPAGEDRSFPWRRSYDDVIRRHSLGRFRMMLREAIVHPAMSGWLNNSSNTKRGINENLGRELLELYTVGRPAGYDEADVKSSARILTGFKVKVFDGYAASYEPNDHYVGAVSVMDFTHPNSAADGRPVVDAYLDHLARHPATAQRLARRLCLRFVSDEPSDDIVTAVAAAYRASDTDIRATLRAMVRHPEFVASAGQKVRTPIEDVVNCARVLDMRPVGATDDAAFARHVVWMSSSVGQMQFDWPRPDGFPETSSTWTSPARMVRSWNIHYALAGNWWGAKDIAIPARADVMPTTWPVTLGQLVDHQSRMLLGRPATATLRQGVAEALNRADTQKFDTASAVSDWTWTVLRGAVLNSPEGMLR